MGAATSSRVSGSARRRRITPARTTGRSSAPKTCPPRPSRTERQYDGDPAAVQGFRGKLGNLGWLDLQPGMNLAQEITGPLTQTVDIPDWFQTQTGNPNSVEDELEAYIHVPVLIPLHNGACREDPGATSVCNNPGVDPVGNNTWYYVHTLAVFYMHLVLVQGNNTADCASPPGSPLVPVTQGAGFLGCLKGWFVNYITSGPIIPGNDPIPVGSAIGIQLIR